MLDIKTIRERPDAARERLASRGRGDEKAIDDLLRLDEERRALILKDEALKAERNKASKEIGLRKAKGENADELLAKMKGVSDQSTALDAERTKVEEAQNALLLTVPNLPHASVPIGADSEANRVERTWGKPPEFPFAPKAHMEIVEKRGLVDFPAAAKISGSGFLVFKGKGARLERALIQYLLDFHTEKAVAPLEKYTEVSPPFLVHGASMTGTGQLPKFGDDMYKIDGEDLYLVPTAEVPVTNLLRDEIIPAEALPIRYAAYTPCFRKEAGSAGRDNRGMIRVHQFDKVELVQVVRPEESYAALERLVGQVEAVLQSLGLHYRVLTLSTGDMGSNAAKCHDLEVWAPGLNTWLEVSSCSNFEDFQARRMNLRFKNAEGRNVFCHTLNGSGTALARLFIALLETYQQPDGSVMLPDVLRPYLGDLSL